jgi:hypothetical protein
MLPSVLKYKIPRPRNSEARKIYTQSAVQTNNFKQTPSPEPHPVSQMLGVANRCTPTAEGQMKLPRMQQDIILEREAQKYSPDSENKALLEHLFLAF